MAKQEKKIFLICPVRNVSGEEKRDIENYVNGIERCGVSVHYPARDTDQVDEIGYRICSDNLAAMKAADKVLVWFNPKSTGTLFDLGMAFALGKKIALINSVKKTEGKSFSNMALEWSVRCRHSARIAINNGEQTEEPRPSEGR